MSEQKTEETKGKPEGQRDPYARLGRRIAAFLAFGGILYLIVVGIVSVVPQVFWPEGETIDPSISCVEGLTDLRGELLARAGEHVASGGSEDRDWMRPWLESWDRRHRGLEERCDNGEDREAWLLVGQARERVQASLVRFDEEEGALARAADRHLDRRR